MNNTNTLNTAIFNLLTCDSNMVTDDSLKLTVCSSDIKVIFNKLGGICIKCNKLFECKISLINHLSKCGIYKGLNDIYMENTEFVNTIPKILIME